LGLIDKEVEVENYFLTISQTDLVDCPNRIALKSRNTIYPNYNVTGRLKPATFGRLKSGQHKVGN
jgi:hypothetical protein